MIETIIFFALVVAIGAVVVKAFEWRQDVLYGPYIGQDDRKHRRGHPHSKNLMPTVRPRPQMISHRCRLRWLWTSESAFVNHHLRSWLVDQFA